MSRSRLHPVPLIAGLLVVLLTAQLGSWQVRRADEKSALQASFEAASRKEPMSLGAAAPEEWRPVVLRGTWRVADSMLLDNRTHRGRAGYHVFSPLRLADSDTWVLVNRGWVAAPGDRATLPEWPTPQGEVTVTGRVRQVADQTFTLGEDPAEGPVRQVLDLADYRERTGLPVADFYVQQTGDAPDGLVRDWPQPDAGVERHRGYALQWYSLAALAGGLTGWYALVGLGRRRVEHERNHD